MFFFHSTHAKSFGPNFIILATLRSSVAKKKPQLNRGSDSWVYHSAFILNYVGD